MTELKPCPFCGEKPTIWQNASKLWNVACDSDNCEILPYGVNFKTETEAINAWNMRA